MDEWIDFDSVLVTKLVLDFVNFLVLFSALFALLDIVKLSPFLLPYMYFLFTFVSTANTLLLPPCID